MTLNFGELKAVNFDQKDIDAAFLREFHAASGHETLESQLQAAFKNFNAAVAVRDAARPMPAHYPDAWDKHAKVLGMISDEREAAICQALEQADGPLLDFIVRVELIFEDEEPQDGETEGDDSSEASGNDETAEQKEAAPAFGTEWLKHAATGQTATNADECMAAFKAMYAVPDLKVETPAKADGKTPVAVAKALSLSQRNKKWAQLQLQ